MVSETILWSSIALPVVLLAKMYRENLILRYPCFSIMLFVGVVRDVWLAALAPESALYSQIWVITMFPFLLSQIAAAIAAYVSLAKFYTGIGAFAGWLYAAGTIAGLVVSFAINHHAYDGAFYSPWVGFAAIAERSVATVLTCATVATCAFLSRFPSPLQRMPSNSIAHLSLLTVFFGLTSLFQFAIGNILEQALERTVETAFLFLTCVCYILWALIFSEQGEYVLHWPDIDPAVRHQVQQLNTQMMRVVREIS
ncbi:MAG: hypothetical protein JOY53_20160 [Acidobacteriaceae bacterium]|nr:hypothetical protein [Acidobacteriaceae bacterium]